MGPGKGTESWDKPLSKFRDRVSRWSGIGGGMQYASVAYNVFALSALLYVAQLEPVPDFVIQEERRLVLSMFPGPGNWVTPEDLWFLKEGFGFAKAPQSLRLVARAAKLRVFFPQTCDQRHSWQAKDTLGHGFTERIRHVCTIQICFRVV